MKLRVGDLVDVDEAVGVMCPAGFVPDRGPSRGCGRVERLTNYGFYLGGEVGGQQFFNFDEVVRVIREEPDETTVGTFPFLNPGVGRV